MKRVVILFLILGVLQSCNKQVEKKTDVLTNAEIDISGEYTGTFTDLNNIEGTIVLSLYRPINGFSGGIVTIKKNSEINLITGTINAAGDGKTINGNFIPSVVDNKALYLDKEKNSEFFDSYQCSWNFYGEIINDSGIVINGKAVPMSCSESNRMEFTLKRNK